MSKESPDFVGCISGNDWGALDQGG